MLLSVSVDLNLHSGPRVFGQSLKKVHTCSIVYLQHSCVSAGETRLSSFSPFEVWFAGWDFSLSPPPLRLWPIPAFGRTHLKRFPYRADPCCWLARWKRSASGLSYQWWHHCMTHRERTSCSTTLLLFFFSASNSSHCIVVFSLLLSLFCFVAVRKRCGLTSGPHLHIVLTPSECTLDYSPLPLFASAYHLFSCNYGRCHPNPAPLRLVMNYSLLLRLRNNNERVSLRGFTSTI